VPSHPGNTNSLRHGVYSRRALSDRALDHAAAIRESAHTCSLDDIAAQEIGSLLALIEAIDADIAERGVSDKRGDTRHMVEMRVRASGRLERWLAQFAMTPTSRAAFLTTIAQGSLAEEIARRRSESP
jgi:hypothetical protein